MNHDVNDFTDAKTGQVREWVRVIRARYLPIVAIFAMLLTTARAGDIGITPTRLELSARPGESTQATVTVLTSATESIRVQAATSDFVLDPFGTLRFLSPATHVHSSSTWTELSVAEFAIRSGQAREVVVQLSVPVDAAANGTYHGVVFFTTAPEAATSDGVGVATATRVGLIVYLTVAGTERAGSELVDMYQSDDRSLTAVILNTGNTVMRLGGVVEIRDEAGDVVRRLDVPDVPVLRESERELTFALPDDLESGFYVALALIEDSRGGILAGELPFDVP